MISCEIHLTFDALYLLLRSLIYYVTHVLTLRHFAYECGAGNSKSSEDINTKNPFYPIGTKLVISINLRKQNCVSSFFFPFFVPNGE